MVYLTSMKLTRIQELRKELELEAISYSELAEIDSAAIEAGIKLTGDMLPSDILDELEKVAK